MTPEVIAFTAHRWSHVRKVRALGGASLSKVTYGVGKICASSCVFTSYRAALEADVAWKVDGIEPRAAETRTDWPAVTDAVLDAVAERLVGR